MNKNVADDKTLTVSQNLSASFEKFGSYILLKKLATGGMAEIFLVRPAIQSANGRIQILKRILPHVANNPMFLSMFQSEIQIIMGFNHPHTVQLHDFGECAQQPYITMEYIEGKNLKEVINKFRETEIQIPVPMSLSLIAQGAAGLHYAHNFVNKVTGDVVHAIHRDISPHNLILSYDGNLKVIDFGIAKAAVSIQDTTRTGTIKGKVAYLSPEQVTGGVLDARSDIFALGVVAWELLTMRKPFFEEGDSELIILDKIRNCDNYIEPPSYYHDGLSEEVDQVVLKALRRNPNERYNNASEFQAALRQVLLKHYSDYSYSDIGKLLKSLYYTEIESEHKELRELNMQVQEALSQQSFTNSYPDEQAQRPGVVNGVFNGIRSMSFGFDRIENRLLEIETSMKKKVAIRHIVLFAIYLITLVALRFDETEMLFNYLFSSKIYSVSQRTPGKSKNQGNSEGTAKSARNPASAKKNSKTK